MKLNNRYSHLLQPGRIGPIEMRNRIVMSGMGTNLSESDGHCGERIQRYYEERARGGCGLVIMGVGAVSWPSGACNPNQVAVSSDEFLPGLKACAERVHRHKSKIAIQLQHAGQVAVRDIAEGRAMLVPSVPKAKPSDMMESLTEEETGCFVRSYSGEQAKIEYRVAEREDIKRLIEDFASAAERLKRAGFDGVELHAAHGYILSSFLSASINRRTDEYGGSHRNRCRLLLETLRAVRERVGKDFGVWCRIDAREYGMENGIELSESVETARLAAGIGADAIHVSSYADSSQGVAFTTAPLPQKRRAYLPDAAAIRKAVNVPVIAVGRIEAHEADAAIAKGKVDFVAMARKLLADPELPLKLLEDRPQDIRPCIYCYTCVSQIFLNQSVMCAVNPATGHENDFEIERAAEKKRVLVIGGGPAGMEAARVAALRGHKVTLCESGSQLGGTLRFASLAYRENGALLRYLINQVNDLPIALELNKTVDRAAAQALSPDAIVIATGAMRSQSEVGGADQRHVFDGDQLRALLSGVRGASKKLRLPQRALLSAGHQLGVAGDPDLLRWASKLWMPLGERVVILGGGLVGVELAEFLSERGRKVTVFEEGEVFGAELAVVRRWRLLDGLKRHDVKLMPKAKAHAIDVSGVVYSSGEDQAMRKMEADAVIIANNARANLGLEGELKGVAEQMLSVGDCNGPGYIVGAMRAGARAGLDI